MTWNFCLHCLAYQLTVPDIISVGDVIVITSVAECDFDNDNLEDRMEAETAILF